MLFKISEISPPRRAPHKRKGKPKADDGPPRPTGGAVAALGAYQLALLDVVKLEHIRKTIGDLSKGCNVHIVSVKDWSAADLIAYIAAHTGPADLAFSSWGLSESAVSILAQLKAAGLLRRIRAIMNHQSVTQRSDPLAQLQVVADELTIHNCHAKVYVITNESWAFSVVTSANMTKNPRIEAGVVTEGREVADFHLAWIGQALTYSGKFKHKPNPAAEAKIRAFLEAKANV